MPIKGTSTIKTNSMQRHNKLQTILFKPFSSQSRAYNTPVFVNTW